MSSDSRRPSDDSSAAQQRFLFLFLRSEREIFRYVAALVPNVTDAEDIVQQTAVALWEKFDAYDRNGDPVSRQALKLSPPFRIGAAELGNGSVRGGPDASPVLIRNLSGSFDEFGLFSRALSDAEVRELYAVGKPNP